MVARRDRGSRFCEPPSALIATWASFPDTRRTQTPAAAALELAGAKIVSSEREKTLCDPNRGSQTTKPRWYEKTPHRCRGRVRRAPLPSEQMLAQSKTCRRALNMVSDQLTRREMPDPEARSTAVHRVVGDAHSLAMVARRTSSRSVRTTRVHGWTPPKRCTVKGHH